MIQISPVRCAIALLIAVGLSGCSDADWDRLNVFPGLGGDDHPASSEPMPDPGDASMEASQAGEPRELTTMRPGDEPSRSVAAAPEATAPGMTRLPMTAGQGARPAYVRDAGDDFCHGAAANAADGAAANGFDSETVQRRYDIQLRQCEALDGN